MQVIQALAADPVAWRHGYDLCRQTGIQAGTMYPILMRLADRGWLETSWEEGALGGRPPRHLYRLTSEGLESARQMKQGQLLVGGSNRGSKAVLEPQMGDAG